MRAPCGIATVVLLCAVLEASSSGAATWVVAETGGDFTSIQAALDAAVAGDTIRVRSKPTPWFEKVLFPRSGDATNGFITLEAFPGESPVLDGSGVAGENVILVDSKSWVRVAGLEIRNNLDVRDGSGIRVIGSGSHIEIRDNEIHSMRGRNAMGITVYGTSPDLPLSDLVIEGNEIHDCEPHPSEALTLNGNVTGFLIADNHVHDVNNIGIDLIGGETDINPDPTKVARDGIVRGNRVERANQKGGGFAGGIYVDGGRDIVIERNVVSESDLGIEIGAEGAGIVASGITVRTNVLFHNERAGLVFGGFSASVGRTEGCTFRNNTLFENDTLGTGFGEIWVQFAENNLVENNLVISTAQNGLVYSDAGNGNNTFRYNLWYAPGGAPSAEFTWNGETFVGFDAWRTGTGQGSASLFADPRLISPGSGDFHLASDSPAIDAASPDTVTDPDERDLDGQERLSGSVVDIGADEVPRTCGDGILDPGEACDDANQGDGDGCDSNCTPTACGNGVVTAGEECDAGNGASGDCCSSVCLLEPDGSACDDGEICTAIDGCAGGLCVGSEEPAASCHRSTRTGSSLISFKDLPDSRRDRLSWRWPWGEATALAELGDPVATTAYALCVYDVTPSGSRLVLSSRAPAGGLCGGVPCWRDLGPRGFRYIDRAGSPDALIRLLLRPGEEGRARIVLRARGALLPSLSLPLAQQPEAVVQLRSDAGACWESRYEAPAVRNLADGSLDRGD
jgi:cysteine-rich repeat protein